MRPWIASGGHLAHAHEQLRIGLNDGFRALPDRWCHWCASGDVSAYRNEYTTHRSTVGYCCLIRSYMPEIAEYGWSGEALAWDDLPALRGVFNPSWSIIAAIALADKLGADDIHIYGWDMAIDECTYNHERKRKELREFGDIQKAIRGSVTIHNTKGNA